jgi:hypothetical protein
MSNKHISQFLDYYINLSNPQYAVLLKGKWGSGKTYFINEYKDKLKKSTRRYIYVSLYGVKNYDEIETKFLQSSNPEIFNEKSIFVGKLADAFINENIKKSLGQMKKSLSSLNAKGNILIFDDLERCSINIVDLLGYINNFVEHQSYKVILIANEEEFKKSKKYTKIKEKLIGKTFEFKTDASSAYDSFLTELENKKDVKENILQKYKNKILEIFKKSQCNNLRILRQGLLDFERLYDLVFINHFSKDKLIDEIIQIFFIFIFEIKSGEFCTFKKLQNDKGKARDKAFAKAFNYKKIEDENIEEEKTVYEIMLSKYDFLLEDNMILSIETWQEIIKNSYIDIDKIDSELKNSSYYFDENTPSWKRLIEFQKLEDDEFEKLLEDVCEKFSNNEYKNYKQFKLVASMLLSFQELNLLRINFEELFILIKDNFNSLFEENFIINKEILFSKNKIIDDTSYENTPYIESFSFQKLLEYIDDFASKKKSVIFKNESEQIINAIKEQNHNKLFELLEGKNDIRIIDYKNEPILSYINLDALFNVLIKTNGLMMHYFGGIIKNRYNGTKELLCEETFLKELLEKIDKLLENHEVKVSTYNLEKEIKVNILIALEELKKIKR